MSKDNTLEYLESERQKIWAKIANIESKLDNSIYDIDDETLESVRDIKEKHKEILLLLKSLSEKTSSNNLKLEELDILIEKTKEQLSIIDLNQEVSIENIENSKNTLSQLAEKTNQINNQIEEIGEFIGTKTEIETEFKEIYSKLNSINETVNKINQLFKNASDRKREIDELHLEIIGSTSKDEDGNEIKTQGLKDELEIAYDEISNNLKILSSEISDLESKSKKRFEDFFTGNDELFKTSLEKWSNEYNSIKEEIKGLLPNALTTGLSYAYSEKKNNEKEELKSFNRTFIQAIWGLIGISTIPFIISIVTIFGNDSLDAIINRIPKIVTAILPIYIPILWVAYSANRKMNLSKRLIEEYSHKEVLSKTFEGLSNQIQNIKEENISSDLRNKLLYNIIEVNSENPGKLISDYNKTDHPLVDAMDKSIKLTNAFTRLSKVPGFSRIANAYAAKAEKLMQTESKKAETGIELNEALENKENNSN